MIRFPVLLLSASAIVFGASIAAHADLSPLRPETKGAAQPAEAEGSFRHMSMLARYHNIMGMETISVLELLTTSITEVITHPTMADRLAAMLNYFLKTLTGPDRKSFKVQNIESYEFR